MIYSISKDFRLCGLLFVRLWVIGGEYVCGCHVSVPLTRFNFSADTLIEIYTKLKCKDYSVSKNLKGMAAVTAFSAHYSSDWTNWPRRDFWDMTTSRENAYSIFTFLLQRKFPTFDYFIYYQKKAAIKTVYVKLINGKIVLFISNLDYS